MTSRLGYLADFDSASAMVRALAAFLHGGEFANLGLSSTLKPLATGANLLPGPLRREAYRLGGHFEAVPPETLDQIRDEEIARWASEQFPARRYPAIMLGSSNGALIHLAAALGIPWLPQTVLIPVRQSASTSTSRSRRSSSVASRDGASWTPTPISSCITCMIRTRIA